jgi:hypothetical protein
MSNGGFFSTMPTVVSNVFGSARVSVAMSMVITGWIGGYLMVSIRWSCSRLSAPTECACIGQSDCWLYS